MRLLDGESQPATIADAIRVLRDKLQLLDGQDSKLISFAGKPQMTHAFFPGGNGLYDGVHSKRVALGGTVILGSNFCSVSKFIDEDQRLRSPDERDGPTWKPLLRILHDSEIAVEDCFFTNAWPFLHADDSNLGPVGDWLRNRALMDSCGAFFELTFSLIKPRLVVGLGTGPAAFLGHVWPDQLAPWTGRRLRHLDDLAKATVELDSHQAVCVAITHPSMPNARLRRPPYRGRSGELQLLIEARRQADLLETRKSARRR